MWLLEWVGGMGERDLKFLPSMLQSRELKSVNLDCTGQLIKLVLHQNHINRLNLFNQVCRLLTHYITVMYTDGKWYLTAKYMYVCNREWTNVKIYVLV